MNGFIAPMLLTLLYILYKLSELSSSKPRDYEVTNLNCWNDTVKIGIFHQISQKVLYLSTPIFKIGWRMEIINLTFILRSPKGCCYGKQLLFGAIHRHLNWPSSLSSLAFHNELQYCHVDLHVVAIIPLHCVKIWWTLVHYPHRLRVECAIFVTNLPQLPTHLHLAHCKWLQYHSNDFSRLIGNNFSTSCRNQVRFDSVMPEIDIRICTADIGHFTGVTLATFAMGHYC